MSLQFKKVTKYNFSSHKIKMDDNEDEDSEINELKVIDNTIYLYSKINNELALNLNTNIKILEKKLLIFSITFNIPPPYIIIRINSEGGDIYAALSIVDTIKNCKVPIHTIIEGCAASAATIISTVAKKRSIMENAHMLIHQMTSGFWGKYTEFKDELQNQNKFMTTIKNIYKNHTNLKGKILDNCLSKDIWWSTDICLKHGLVDEIIKSDNTNNSSSNS
tara:strand:- start:991 stop:1650 length:660 start_codon:yes stop_codon:yes gene_type:complete